MSIYQLLQILNVVLFLLFLCLKHDCEGCNSWFTVINFHSLSLSVLLMFLSHGGVKMKCVRGCMSRASGYMLPRLRAGSNQDKRYCRHRSMIWRRWGCHQQECLECFCHSNTLFSLSKISARHVPKLKNMVILQTWVQISYYWRHPNCSFYHSNDIYLSLDKAKEIQHYSQTFYPHYNTCCQWWKVTKYFYSSTVLK